MEQEMIRRLLAREEAGMADLLLHYGPLMRYIIAPILPNPQDREDCLSEVTLRVWEKIEQYDRKRGSWNAWLTAMRNEGWRHADDIDLRTVFSESFSALPPEEVVRDVTPWKRAMNRVLIGMVLCTITLNFWYLNYILPAVGMVLWLLGLRALRRENGYFTACFVLILLRCACFFPTLILNTFACRDDFIPERVTTALTQVSVAVQLLGLFCLWLGLRAVQQKAGLPPRAGGVLALMLWYGVVYLLVLIQYPGMILPLILLVAFIFILRSICKTTKALSEAGYTMHPAPVKVPDLWLVLILAAVLVLGCAAGYLFGAQHSMDWQPLEETRSAETAEIKAHLLDLGFPEVILNDLAEEDLAACAGALRVDAESKVYSPTLEHEKVSAGKRLRITDIAVQIPGEKDTWIILHHFLWEKGPLFFGTDALQVWPMYQLKSGGWAKGGDITGRLLYDRDGQTYTAPYYFLGEARAADTGFLSLGTARTDIYAGFSLPREGENRRGYLTYTMFNTESGYSIISYFNYTHQHTWFQYPATTALKAQMSSRASNYMDPFAREMTQFWFTPSSEHLQWPD